MKLIVGLGNPGRKYEHTRHNAGFWLLERFAAKYGIALRNDAKFQALVGRHDTTGTWLLMPQAYMNASGRPVQMLASFFKIAPEEILVAHDELDFPPGTIRIKLGGGVAGHNGLKDISARLGTHDYWRLRIGIGHPGTRDLVTHHLLNSHPAPDERATIEAALDRALDVMPLVLSADMAGAMHRLHTEEKPPKAERETRNPAANAEAHPGSKRKAGATDEIVSSGLPEPDPAQKK